MTNYVVRQLDQCHSIASNIIEGMQVFVRKLKSGEPIEVTTPTASHRNWRLRAGS